MGDAGMSMLEPKAEGAIGHGVQNCCSILRLTKPANDGIARHGFGPLGSLPLSVEDDLELGYFHNKGDNAGLRKAAAELTGVRLRQAAWGEA